MSPATSDLGCLPQNHQIVRHLRNLKSALRAKRRRIDYPLYPTPRQTITHHFEDSSLRTGLVSRRHVKERLDAVFIAYWNGL